MLICIFYLTLTRIIICFVFLMIRIVGAEGFILFTLYQAFLYAKWQLGYLEDHLFGLQPILVQIPCIDRS